MVRIADAMVLEDRGEDVALYFFGQRLLQEVVHGGDGQLDGHTHDEDADDDGRNGVEHRPAVSEEDGAADAQRCADGREGV